MKYLRMIIPIVLAAGAMPQAVAQSNGTGQRAYAATPADYGYQLFLPNGYQPKGKERWPLIIFLHGSGERGSDLAMVKVHGPPKIVDRNPDFPFITLSPQLEAGGEWNPGKLDRMLATVKKQARIDESRVYLTGLSLGGFGAWQWAEHSPQHFAAIAPVAGGGTMIDGGKPVDPCKLKSIGMWLFHGDNDAVVDPAGSYEMANAARKCGIPVRLTIYPNTGHDSWTATYDDPALYMWFLEHRRPSTAR